MIYQRWVHRQGTFVVTKYSGELDFNNLIGNTKETFENLPGDDINLIKLTDISGATLNNTPEKSIPSIQNQLHNISKNVKSVKIAVYTGLINLNDYQKINKYVSLGNIDNVTIMSFNFLDIAMNWLKLTEDEKISIQRDLLT